MFNIETIQTAFYTWVATQLPLVPVIWLNPNAPRPPSKYISLSLSMLDGSNGFDWVTPPDEDGFASLFGNREVSLEVNYYDDKAAAGLSGMQIMETLQTSLGQFDVQQTLLTSGIAYVNRLTLLNIPELLDTRWQERFILELRFRVSNQGVTAPSKFEVGFIERVAGSGELENEKGAAIEVDFDVDVN